MDCFIPRQIVFVAVVALVLANAEPDADPGYAYSVGYLPYSLHRPYGYLRWKRSADPAPAADPEPGRFYGLRGGYVRSYGHGYGFGYGR